MYQIFHGKHLLILTNKSYKYPELIPDFKYKNPNYDQIKEMLKVSKNSTKALVIFLIGKPKQTLESMLEEFKLIKAAGGLVINERGRVLTIKRDGKWDLPKGKFEKGEEPPDCALREVQEETGIKKLKIGQYLTNTYHTYFRNEKWIIKKTRWYIMSAPEKQEFVPQLDEKIEKVKWIKPSKFHDQEFISYPAIRWIMGKYEELADHPEEVIPIRKID